MKTLSKIRDLKGASARREYIHENHQFVHLDLNKSVSHYFHTESNLNLPFSQSLTMGFKPDNLPGVGWVFYFTKVPKTHSLIGSQKKKYYDCREKAEAAFVKALMETLMILEGNAELFDSIYVPSTSSAS